MAYCSECGREIPVERLEAIPDAMTCVEHSGTHRRIGYMVGTAAKGCAATLMMVPDDKEAIRQARRAFMRSR